MVNRIWPTAVSGKVSSVSASACHISGPNSVNTGQILLVYSKSSPWSSQALVNSCYSLGCPLVTSTTASSVVPWTKNIEGRHHHVSLWWVPPTKRITNCEKSEQSELSRSYLNGISLMNLVMASGISVEFTSHIVREYALVEGGASLSR